MKTLLLQLDRYHHLAGWQLRDVAGVAVDSRQGADWASVPVAEQFDRVLISLPGEMVAMLMVTPPEKLRERDYAKAIPFLVEEQLSQPIESLSFVVGDKDADGRLAVAVFETTKLTHCIEQLAEHSLSPVAMLPNYLLLPWQERCWSLLVLDDSVLLRSGYQNGAVIDRDNIRLFLTAMLEHEEQLPESFLLVNTQQHVVSSDLESLFAEIQAVSSHSDNMQFDGAELVGEPAINLMPRARRRKKSQQPGAALFGSWRLVVGLCVGLVVCIFANAGFKYALLSRQVAQASAQVTQYTQQILPNQSGGDPKQAIQAALALMQQTQRSNPFITTLETAGDILTETPLIKMLDISYQDSILTLVLGVDHQSTLQKLATQMNAQGLVTTQQVKAQTARGIIASIKIKGASR